MIMRTEAMVSKWEKSPGPSSQAGVDNHHGDACEDHYNYDYFGDHVHCPCPRLKKQLGWLSKPPTVPSLGSRGGKRFFSSLWKRNKKQQFSWINVNTFPTPALIPLLTNIIGNADSSYFT